MTFHLERGSRSGCSFLLSALAILIVINSGSKVFAQSAHEHGLAQLNLVREGQQVLIEFSSPAMNFLGFERAPETDEEKELLESVSTALESSNWLLGSGLANCELSVEAMELPAIGHDEHDHDEEEHSSHDHDEHSDGHSDFRVQYLFDCQSAIPAQLQITAFENYPGIERITTQYIVERTPGFSELTAGNSTLVIE